MAYYLTIPSLEKLCAKSVAKNLDKFKWHQNSMQDEGDSSHLLSPFDVLPPLVCASIMRAVTKTKGTTRQKELLELLITRRLEELDLISFYGLSESTSFHLLRSAALRHSPLKTLKFCLKQTPYRQLELILPAFPHLQVLDVSWSTCVNDSFMSLVAIFCPTLKSFCVGNCISVTDVGIQRLFTSIEASSGAGGICSSLVTLNIRGTKVTKRGARFALEHLTKLQTFEWGPSTVYVIRDMYGSGHRRPLLLKSLDFDKERFGPVPKDDSFVSSVVKLCPFLTNVTIKMNFRQNLRSLIELNNVERLDLEDAICISFDEELLPLLEKFGHSSLEFLCARDISEMNLGAIVEHCSMLRSFSLFGVGRFTHSPRSLKPSPRHLPHLQRLKIKATDIDNDDLLHIPVMDQPSSSELLLLLASAPALVKLELEIMDNLSDGILEQAIAQHGFNKLEKLEITSCPNVTRNAVDLFLDLDSPLKYITIERYRFNNRNSSHDESKVVRDDPEWNAKMERKKGIVDIHYCECDGPSQ